VHIAAIANEPCIAKRHSIAIDVLSRILAGINTENKYRRQTFKRRRYEATHGLLASSEALLVKCDAVVTLSIIPEQLTKGAHRFREILDNLHAFTQTDGAPEILKLIAYEDQTESMIAFNHLSWTQLDLPINCTAHISVN
jgi:hypothetical protein